MMKRSLAIILLALLLLVALTGCHGKRETLAFEMPETFDEGRSYEISFWAKNDTNKTQVAIYEKAIRDFEAFYPNIKVNLKLYTDYGKIYNDVITNIATGTTPNVCITYPDHIATYLSGEHTVVPLDRLIADERYGLGGSEVKFDAPTVDEIIPEYLAECRLLGDCYALPYMRSTEACYVNKTYVEKLGFTLPETLTWDFIWEVSEAATAKDADGRYVVNGQKTLIPFIYKSTDNMMISYLKQMNAPYSSENGAVQIFNETTEEFLYAIADHAGSRAFSTFAISGYPANFLNKGQCIFAIDSTAGATWMGSNAPLLDISADTLVQFETAVMTIPQVDPENPRMISQGPSVCVFNKADAGEVMASWLFTQYLLTNDVQIAYSQTEGYVPVTKKAQESPEYLDYLSRGGEDNALYYDVKIKATKLMIENVENTFTTPVFNGSTSLRDAAGHLIESAARAARRKDVVDGAYIDGLYADTASLFRLGTFHATGDKIEFGTLPRTAVVLLSAIAIIWIGIIGYLLCEAYKKRKNRRKDLT